MKYVLNKTTKEIRDVFLSGKTVLIRQVNGDFITSNQQSDPPATRAIPQITIVGSESYETLESFGIDDGTFVWCYIGGKYYGRFYNSAEEALNSYFVIHDDEEEEE